MKRTILSFLAAAMLFAVATPSMAVLLVRVTDLNDNSFEDFTDAATPGILAVTSATSTILGGYWDGSLQINASNYQATGELAQLISASINLTSLDVGQDVLISVLATGYTNAGPDPAEFETVVNAATVAQASFDAAVIIDRTNIVALDGVSLLSEFGIADTNTRTAAAAFAVGPDFSILHSFTLNATDFGGSLGFDISTRQQAVAEPGALALMGLGLIGMVGARSRMSR